MSNQILLKNGTLLVHDASLHVFCQQADLLITGNIISHIQESIEAGPSMMVIDCTGDIISPGFISTHHHLWQTQLKGSHADHTLLEYFGSGAFQGAFFEPEDVFWGQLSGALESIDAGTTTVVDHAHINHSPKHCKTDLTSPHGPKSHIQLANKFVDNAAEEALRATITSGLRSIFCYCPTPRVARWQPKMSLEQDMLPPWVMENFYNMAISLPSRTDGRVKLGFAFDGSHLPPQQLTDVFETVRQSGSHLITWHAVHGAMFGKPRPSMVNKLATNNLLAPDMLLSHANNLAPSDVTSVQKAGAHISSTPTSELHMGHGNPVCLNKACYSFSSLGIDCHSFCSSSIPAQMASALQHQRSARHASFEQRNEWARSNERTVEDVYNLGTILGARAIRLEDEIGSLRVGKKADVVIFRGDTPSMLVVAERDPVAAIVLHSSVRDVRTVIIDGVIRKSEGVLESVSTTDELGIVPEESCRTIDWGQVARAVTASRRRLEEQLSGVDLKAMQDGVMESFHLNRAQMRDE